MSSGSGSSKSSGMLILPTGSPSPRAGVELPTGSNHSHATDSMAGRSPRCVEGSSLMRRAKYNADVTSREAHTAQPHRLGHPRRRTRPGHRSRRGCRPPFQPAHAPIRRPAGRSVARRHRGQRAAEQLSSHLTLQPPTGHEPREGLSRPDDPLRPYHGCKSKPRDRQVRSPPSAMGIGADLRRLHGGGRVEQPSPKPVGVRSGDPQRLSEHSRLVPSARKRRIKTVVRQLANVMPAALTPDRSAGVGPPV
jgi:hypothetical protein